MCIWVVRYDVAHDPELSLIRFIGLINVPSIFWFSEGKNREKVYLKNRASYDSVETADMF